MTRPISYTEVIGRQLIVKQLMDVIAAAVSGYYLWLLSRNYSSVGLGTDADP